jgi:membrane-associated protein
MQFIELFTQVDKQLNDLAASMGPWLYAILFLVIFCETGLVVTPFLPGDSLLFAVGALAATADSPLSLGILVPLLIVAAVIGDGVNYAIGRFIGPKIFRAQSSLLFNRKHLDRAQSFYERYGSKTIVLARFVPIVRTFAPFVAGVGKMSYAKFWIYNFIGAVAWVGLCLFAGYAFGNIPFVKNNFELVILMIIGISVLPIAIEAYREWRRSKGASKASQQT